MFCDICDQFDLHETEDCPQQEQDAAPANLNKPDKKKPAPRPYCESCESKYFVSYYYKRYKLSINS